MCMASMRESRDSDRFLVTTQVQSHALVHRGFGTSVPFIPISFGNCWILFLTDVSQMIFISAL